MDDFEEIIEPIDNIESSEEELAEEEPTDEFIENNEGEVQEEPVEEKEDEIIEPEPIEEPEPPLSFFYGLIDDSWGFLESTDNRVTPDMIEVSVERHQELLDEQSQGLQIVCYDGEVFTAEPDYYYVDENNEWQMRTEEEVEEIREQRERVRVANLHMTRGDVFRGLLLAKGVTRTQLRAIIEQLPDETNEQSITKEMALIDFDEALEYYRGVALIDTVGTQLGISSQQMTRFFETKDWHELLEASDENTDE